MLKEAIHWYKYGQVPAKDLPRVALRLTQARLKPYTYKLKQYFPNLRVQTSQSDRIEYNLICRRAVENEGIFRVFKRHPDYKPVLEHLTEEQGQQYLEIIQSEYPHLLKRLDLFRTNDSIGSPETYEYEGVGRFSSTTLRYIKVLGDLQHLFGSLEGYRIIEIGAGYGGQCKIISDAVQYTSSTVVDLDQALRLINKYLTTLNVPNVIYQRQEEVGEEDYDLCISNYAFSECAKPVQDYYIERVLRRSKRGYITYNGDKGVPTLQSPWTPYNGPEIMERLSAYHTISKLPERPQTGHKTKNFIIVWNDHE